MISELKDIIESENSRTKENLGTIYLYKESENTPWFKAYEFSAYLAEFYPSGNEEKLKPIKKRGKNTENEIVNIGIQVSSFNKYFPGADVENIDNGSVSFTVDLTRYGENISLENYKEKTQEWKDGINLSEKTDKKAKQQNNVFTKPLSVTKIMAKIMNYDTHGKDENGLRGFIIEIKNDFSNILF